jgi:hypothetical protein
MSSARSLGRSPLAVLVASLLSLFALRCSKVSVDAAPGGPGGSASTGSGGAPFTGDVCKAACDLCAGSWCAEFPEQGFTCPKYECSARCMVKFGKCLDVCRGRGDPEDELRDCLAACSPPIACSPGPGGGSGQGDMCAWSLSAYAPRSSACKAELDACEKSPACRPFGDCILPCGFTTDVVGCIDGCKADAGSGSPEEKALLACGCADTCMCRGIAACAPYADAGAFCGD